MRALIWIVLAASSLWFGWWFVASTGVERGATNWFAELHDRGLVAENAGISVTGFPNRVDLNVAQPHIADPDSQLGWSAPFLQVFAMTWKPWHVIAALPHEQTFTLPDQAITLTSDRFMASLALHPGPALALNETVVEVEAPKAASTNGWALAAAKVVISTRDDPSRANAHRLGMRIDDLAPDAGLLAALQDQNLPALITLIRLDASARFTAPLDRAVGTSHPQLQGFDLAEARLDWGRFSLTAKGGMEAGPDGLAVGEIAIRIQDWRTLPPLLAALGLISPQMAPTLERGLEVMAKSNPDPAVLDLTLKAADGKLRLGPLPLGNAPVLRRDLAAPAG